jgi:hypothetical protein
MSLDARSLRAINIAIAALSALTKSDKPARKVAKKVAKARKAHVRVTPEMRLAMCHDRLGSEVGGGMLLREIAIKYNVSIYTAFIHTTTEYHPNRWNAAFKPANRRTGKLLTSKEARQFRKVA